MTDCERNLEYISAYLDGELSAAEAAELSRHLEVCPSCKALLEDLTAIRDNLAEGAVEGLPELPEGLHEQIMDAVRSERKVVSRAPVLWRRWGVLAAALAIVVVSATYGQNMLRMGSTGTADTATMAPASTNSAAGSSATAEADSEEMMTYGVATEDAAAEDSVQSKDVQRSMVAPVAPVPGDAGTVMMAEAPASMMDPAGEASYRGILTVEGLPPELEPYAPEDGTTEFTLPAEEFESVVEQLTAREAAFTLERPEGGEDADFSLVIVLPAQG